MHTYFGVNGIGYSDAFSNKVAELRVVDSYLAYSFVCLTLDYDDEVLELRHVTIEMELANKLGVSERMLVRTLEFMLRNLLIIT